MKKLIIGGAALATAGMLLSQVSAFAATQNTTTPQATQVKSLTLPSSVSASSEDGERADKGVDQGPNVQDQVGGQTKLGGADLSMGKDN
ncbi:hypothetical protein [Ferroacidibacillus organovorans]|uniref:Uncharacterized protein n=1 Tax=Ferroacidibacillus organovorans TaxID=1765683 RepID=A0A124IW80_9BACL|nr:hypothetical protein [Ferroacidibacillus organovorans]KUO96560.1 hypothetical protein ATW55_00295 [Ferroacidibacillus organovorans]